MGSDVVRQTGTALSTVIIFTSHMEKLAQFHKDGLQLGPYERSAGHLGQRIGEVYFGFDQVSGAESAGTFGATLWFTVDDIQRTFNRLVELGATVKYQPAEKPWGALLAAVLDPDGNLLGLSQRQP